MQYMILDNETENYTSRKRKANPFDDRNYIVLRGWKHQGDSRCSAARFAGVGSVEALPLQENTDVLVGHNIKFDLHYEMVNEHRTGVSALRDYFSRGGRIWDTQLAEYLLRAQEQKYHMCAMNDIIEDYGGRKKIDGIKELWEAGVRTSEIDPDLLLDYLIGTEEEGRNSGDIGNTEIIFRAQIKHAKKIGMLHSIWRRMDSLLCTTEMEYNGLYVDVRTASKNLKSLNSELDQVTTELNNHTAHIPEEVDFNWNSNVHTSVILFGGTIKYSKRDTYIDETTGKLARKRDIARWPLFEGEPRDPRECSTKVDKDGYTRHYIDLQGYQILSQDMYLSGKKKGQPKTKRVSVPGELKVKYQDFFYEMPGVTAPDPEWRGALTDGKGGPVYSTSSDVVEVLAKRDIPFLKVLGRYQALNKEIGTYYVRHDLKKGYVGMLACVDPDTRIVHHSLNHSSTVTTRLSSNNPNLQNVPRGDKSRVKEMFASRFGDDGVVLEADYSQLEVIVQALLSRDKNLIRDVQNRVDFHCKRVALKYGVPYEFALEACKNEEHEEYAKWKPRRTAAKEFSFQRAYGAGASAISASTGIPQAEVEEMIRIEESEYPGVKRFNDAVLREVSATAEPFRDGARGWRQFRRGYYQSPTGCLYSWRTYDAPEWIRKKGILDNFKPTEIKNYPIQGTGGELVQLTLGLLFRWFARKSNFNSKAFLVNTVHDCVWVDVHKSVLHEVAGGVQRIMESIPQQLKRYYGLDCPVPFPVEVETGPNMLDLKHYNQED